MKKSLWVVLALVLSLMIGGCGTQEAAKQEAVIPMPELAAGDVGVVLTDELRQQYFDLAQAMRWDFLPVFEAGNPPTDLANYLYFVYPQQLEWENYYTLKNDGDMSISADYVSDYVRRHFGVELEHPQAGENLGHFTFDGKKYTPASEGWPMLPFFQLESVGVSEENGKTVYCVEMMEYDCEEMIPDDKKLKAAKQAVISGKAEQYGLKKQQLIVVCYSVNEETGDLVYEAVSGQDVN